MDFETGAGRGEDVVFSYYDFGGGDPTGQGIKRAATYKVRGYSFGGSERLHFQAIALPRERGEGWTLYDDSRVPTIIRVSEVIAIKDLVTAGKNGEDVVCFLERTM